MRRRALAVSLAVLAVAVAACSTAEADKDPPAEPVEYFVAPGGDNAASGTSAVEAFGTIGRALEVVEPGDTIYVLPGEYREPVVLDGIGSASAPIRIMGINGLPVLAGDGGGIGIECRACVNVDISCFDLRGFGEAAVLARDATGLVVRDLVVSGPGRHGIRVVDSSEVLVEWLDISGLSDPAGAAIRFEGVTRATVAHNRAYDLAGESYSFVASDVEAADNQVPGGTRGASPR